jgi:branched-chain amino acid transport system permease protein
LRLRLGVVALVIALLLLPLFVRNNFHLHVLIMTAVYVIMATSLWLILRSGQLSIGHAAFQAIGAYAAALLVMRVDLPFWLALPLAGLVAAIVAVIIGYPSLRLKGLFFALVTFAFAEILRVALNSFGKGIFGGASGISGIPHPDFFGIELTTKTSYYYLALGLMLVTVFVLYRIYKSRIGMTLVAISSADALAESLGVNTMRHKVFAFAVCSFFAGVAGAFYATYIRHVSPESFTFWHSVYALVYVVVGGQGTILGPMVGACALSAFSEGFRTFGDYQPIVYGTALVVVVLFLPAGLISLPSRLRSLATSLGSRLRRSPAIASGSP